MQPESKFLNAEYLDRGTTRRRHVRMTVTRHIGKESNDWERQAVLGLTVEAQPDYGISEEERLRIADRLREFVARVGKRKASKALGTTPLQVDSFLAGASNAAMGRLAQSLAERLEVAMRLYAKLDHDRQTELSSLRMSVTRIGLRATLCAMHCVVNWR